MKKLIIIALLALGMSASAQKTTLFFVDTITDANGIQYTNTFDGIRIYHESDELLYESESDVDGNWFSVYYNDTVADPIVYVYYMAEELCYKMETYTLSQIKSKFKR